MGVSRSFGCYKFKKGNGKVGPQSEIVTCVPDVRVHNRSDEDMALLVASDGLFDVISSDQSVGRINDILQLGESSAKLFAEELLDGALIEGKSRDNITAIVCIFPAGNNISKEARSKRINECIGVEGIRSERIFAGKMPSVYDMYDNVKFLPEMERAPGSMFYSEDY